MTTLLSLIALLHVLATVQAQDTPGCRNARLDNGHVVADCVDDVTGKPFLYVDINDKFKGPFDNPTPDDSDAADSIFASWVSAGSNATAKQGQLRLRSAPYIPSRDSISASSLSVAEAGLAGGVQAAASSVTSFCSDGKCDPKHVITYLKGANTALGVVAGVSSIAGLVLAIMGRSKDGNVRRDECAEIHKDGFNGRVCASYAKGDAMFMDEGMLKQAITSCVDRCVVNHMSCQRSWISKTQQNNCKPWYCPWCNDDCPIEEHTNNICISDRPNGCTINKKLHCNIDPPK